MRGYAALVRRPGAAGLVAASGAARLSFGVFDLALVLLVQRATGSFALAGVAVGAHAAGIAVTAPLRGRLLDRRGARVVLPPLALAHAGLIAALPVAAALGADAAIVALALLAGALVPPLAPAMRLEWQRLLGAGTPLLERAYAFETALQLGVYVVGPLLTAGVVAVAGPASAVLVAAALVLAGTLAFAPRARAEPTAGAVAVRGLGAIRAPGLVTLVLVAALADAGLGVVDLAVVAAATEQGAGAAAGVLLALFATGSVAGAALFGARRWPGTPAVRLGAVTVLAAVALLPLAAVTGTLAVLGALLPLAGALAAAGWVARTVVLDDVAPAGAGAEAYTWLSSANAAGIALGGAAGGAVIDAAGASAGFVAAAGFATCAVLALLARRRTLGPPPPPPPAPPRRSAAAGAAARGA